MARLKFEKFPIGFWGTYPYAIEGMDETQITDMAECGITLTMSPWIAQGKEKAALRALDLCEKHGIALILQDRRSHWTHIRQGAGEYRANMRQAYEDFGKHPACFGFFLGDEPREADMDLCTEAYRIALEEGPGLVPYLNQYPGYADKCRKFVRESGCRLLSYDRYDQMNPNDLGEGFIRDLTTYKKLADEVDVPLLSIMLSTGHFRYRVPSEDDLRWQVGCALACGADAIFWYTYYTPIRSNNYRGGPISEFGDKTPTYYAMKNVHRRFLRDHAELFCSRKHLGVYAFGRSCAGMADFVAQNVPAAKETGVLNVKSTFGTPGFITFLEGEGKYAGKKYVMITNNSCDKCDMFVLTVSPDKTKFFRVYSENEVDFAVSHWDARFACHDDGTECGAYLAPGQFEIFRFE